MEHRLGAVGRVTYSVRRTAGLEADPVPGSLVAFFHASSIGCLESKLMLLVVQDSSKRKYMKIIEVSLQSSGDHNESIHLGCAALQLSTTHPMRVSSPGPKGRYKTGKKSSDWVP